MGVFNSWVMAFRKLSCCSFRRTSRTRKMVLRITPAMMTGKKITPENQRNNFPPVEDDPTDVEHRRDSGDENAQVMKKTIVVVRLVMRMGSGGG